MLPRGALSHQKSVPATLRIIPAEWQIQTALFLQDAIKDILSVQGECSVMLTGGRSAEKVFAAWGELLAFHQLTRVRFYFGDERCVSPCSSGSNYGMALRTLFKSGVPPGCSIFRIEADDTDFEAAAQRYAAGLPSEIDILLLGVGEDGHIASLFPGSAALQERKLKMVPVIGPRPYPERITITPILIRQARSLFVFADGPGKAAVLVKALECPGDVATLPARLVLHATWFLDSPCDGRALDDEIEGEV